MTDWIVNNELGADIRGKLNSIPNDGSVAQVATADQGSKADTATQPGDLATVATSGDYNDLMNKPVTSAKLSRLGVIGTDSNPYNFVLSGTYAYVWHDGGNTSQLEIIDVAGPISPRGARIVGTISSDTPGGDSIVKSGNTLYGAGRASNKVTIIDVTTPASPSVLTTIDTDNLPQSLAIVGSTLYVAAQDDHHIQLFDVTDPSIPVAGTVLTTTDHGMSKPSTLLAQDGFLYVMNYQSPYKLLIYDLTDPTTPTFVSVIGRSGANAAFPPTKNGDVLYYADYNSGHVYAYDVVDPATPVQHTFSESYVNPLNITQSRGVLYLLQNDGSSAAGQIIRKISIDSDPFNGVTIASASYIGTAIAGIAADNNYVYVTEHSGTADDFITIYSQG
jgi:hypothetical protein